MFRKNIVQYIIISMIILNNYYETIISLCRKVQIVLQINSQFRKKLLKKISLRKSIFIVQTCFYFPHHRHHIEVTNSLLCRNTQYYAGLDIGYVPAGPHAFLRLSGQFGPPQFIFHWPEGPVVFFLVLRMQPLFLLGIGKTRKATLIRTYFWRKWRLTALA